MKTEGLTNSKFASILGIQRSTMTHIIDGRNKPSISFLEKLIDKFPHVNIEWFITGEGDMYKQNETTEPLRQTKTGSPTLFSEMAPDSAEQIADLIPKQATAQKIKTHIPSLQTAESVQKTNNIPKKPKLLPLDESDSTEKNTEQEIEYVLIFHADKTFKYYKPV
jgi:DNA-binding XRE family transcriptional regulator